MSEEERASAGHPADLGDGSQALAVGYADERIALVVDRAYPPGRPLTLALALPSGPLSLQGKTISSKRRPDTRYDVRAKLSSLRREQRALLENTFQTHAPIDQ